MLKTSPTNSTAFAVENLLSRISPASSSHQNHPDDDEYPTRGGGTDIECNSNNTSIVDDGGDINTDRLTPLQHQLHHQDTERIAADHLHGLKQRLMFENFRSGATSVCSNCGNFDCNGYFKNCSAGATVIRQQSTMNLIERSDVCGGAENKIQQLLEKAGGGNCLSNKPFLKFSVSAILGTDHPANNNNNKIGNNGKCNFILFTHFDLRVAGTAFSGQSLLVHSIRCRFGTAPSR